MRWVMVSDKVLPVETAAEIRVAREAIEQAGLFSAEVMEGGRATGLFFFCIGRVR